MREEESEGRAPGGLCSYARERRDAQRQERTPPSILDFISEMQAHAQNSGGPGIASAARTFRWPRQRESLGVSRPADEGDGGRSAVVGLDRWAQ